MMKLNGMVKSGELHNMNIIKFDFNLPEIDTNGIIGLHDKESSNTRNNGRVPMRSLARIISNTNAGFLKLEGYCQNILNFPERKSLDVESLIPHFRDLWAGGAEDELVISVRGGEILAGIHSDYVMIPIGFYKELIEKTGKKPVFFGQIDDNPYIADLRSQFPAASFVASRSPIEDFNFIRKSKNIVLSISTFAWMAAWLSDANKIYMPVCGIFNPAQHPGSMLLPLDDPRYEFILFPVYYMGNVSDYRQIVTPVDRLWHSVSATWLKYRYDYDSNRLDDYGLCFNPSEYCEMYPETREIAQSYGDAGLSNHFFEEGYWNGLLPCRFDRVSYIRNHPGVGVDISEGRYKDCFDHYARTGRSLGYTPH